jgi:TonB family protein
MMEQSHASASVVNPKPKVRIPSFSVERVHFEGNVWTRLVEFFTERPVKLPKNFNSDAAARIYDTFGESFFENFKMFFTGGPRLRGPAHSRMLVEEKSGLQVFWQNLKDLIAPPKLPPLKLSSKPVKVKEIWSKDEAMPRATAYSVALHAVAALILLFPIGWHIAEQVNAAPVKVSYEIVDISPYVPKLPPGKDKAGGGGGGGERDLKNPPSKGRLPKFSLRDQLTPAMVTIKNPNPKIAAEPTVLVPPDIRVAQPNTPNYGDPLAALLTGSGGPGGGGGAGTGCCGGIGSGSGPGVGPGSGGGIGGGVFRPGRNGVGEPVCIFCPDPKFTEEARKAKYQGTVLLRLIVLPDGRPTNISVARGLGMGLDENALEAVKGWKFKPANGPNGKPVPVEVYIEVTFRLL